MENVHVNFLGMSERNFWLRGLSRRNYPGWEMPRKTAGAEMTRSPCRNRS